MKCLTLPETVTLYSPGFADPLQMPHPCHRFWKCYKTTKPSCFAHFWQKVLRALQFFALLTSKCASRHNGVHFLDISTSKSGPELVWFLRFDFEMCFTPQRRALFRHLNFQKWSGAGVVSTFWLRNVLHTTTACTFSTSQLPKVVRSWCGFYVLTSKCASHHNGVHFFDISTSKSGPELVWFLRFDFEMCFTPQRRALFRHLNFQKWSGAGVVSTFWLRNVLHTTTACTFSTSQLPKVVRSWCGFYVLTSKCASHHNGVHFFDISTSKSGPELVWFLRFDFEMCFTPQRRALFRHLNFQKWSGAGVVSTFWLRNVLHTTTACTFSTSQLPKVVRSWCGFSILTSKCASRYTGVCFFDIATSKSGPELVWFLRFDFEMCFTPQRRALFRHLNFQKWSGAGVVSPFWLRSVLRATPACAFSTSKLPKVVRSWCAFVHFDLEMCFAPQRRASSSLIWPAGSAPAAWASLLFDPLEPQIIGTTQCFATVLPFRAPGSSFFWDFLFFDLLSSSLLFSSLTLPTSAFHLSILSEVWLLNFLRPGPPTPHWVHVPASVWVASIA